MKGIFPDAARRASSARDSWRRQASLLALATASSLMAPMLALTAVFELANGLRGVGLVGLAATVSLLALRLREAALPLGRLRPVQVMSAGVLGFVYVIAVSTLTFVLLGDIDGVWLSLYESVAGVSTSALTAFADPAVLKDSTLIWRSATQWIGGLMSLSLSVAVLPFAAGAAEMVDSRRHNRSASALAPRPGVALRRVVWIYAIVSLVVCAVLLLCGMSVTEALVHTLSSVSTGGFSTHADSVAHFDSRLIESVMIVTMAGAGCSIGLVWMIWRREFRQAWNTFELRLYFIVLLGGSAILAALTFDEREGNWGSAFDATFTLVSVVTTTGYRAVDWRAWAPGIVFLLLLAMAVGAMSASVGGGLRWVRIIGLAQFVGSELQRQLHPRSVRSISLGKATLSEPAVDRMLSQVHFTIAVGALLAAGLTLNGAEFIEGFSLAVGALSTTGLGVSDSDVISSAAGLRWESQAMLMPVMLAGRVFLYPALIVVGAGISVLRRSYRARAVTVLHRNKRTDR